MHQQGPSFKHPAPPGRPNHKPRRPPKQEQNFDHEQFQTNVIDFLSNTHVEEISPNTDIFLMASSPEVENVLKKIEDEMLQKQVMLRASEHANQQLEKAVQQAENGKISPDQVSNMVDNIGNYFITLEEQNENFDEKVFQKMAKPM